MNRAEMVAAVADAIYASREMQLADKAKTILNAILPQVTTEDELEALPDDYVVMRGNGYACPVSVAKERRLIKHGSLTVVWTP